MQIQSLWNLFEYAGGLLALCGVIGQAWAEVREAEQDQIGELSSMVLTVGLLFSLTVLVGADNRISASIAPAVQSIIAHR